MAEEKDKPRLIERGFCLKQASIDSVHEKNVRHGHISTLHIWPARRPLAACRAALIATLLPDPGDPQKRKDLLERIGGKVVRVQKRTKKNGKEEVRYVEETEGGILHWGRESNPDLDYFREEIRKAYGGRAPKVLDPFAGGGAIPLEAMRLGCEATAVDISPVAWFLEKCTLEYPQQFAGQKQPLPRFILDNEEFMNDFYRGVEAKPSGSSTKKTKQSSLAAFDGEKMIAYRDLDPPMADLAWHVRAWGWWVLEESKKSLSQYYPQIDNKPTVAYLWARTVSCKNCRATIPLLKTRWLCKKDKKRVLLAMKSNESHTSVVFDVITDVAHEGRNRMENSENDKRRGQGTMTRNGAWCPCCGKPGTVAMSLEDIRREGVEGRLGAIITAVVVDGEKGKEYRLPTNEEVELMKEASEAVEEVYRAIPFGIPDEPTPIGGNGASRAFSVDKYGFDNWSKLFTARQLLSIGTLVDRTRNMLEASINECSREWAEAVFSYLVISLDRLINQSSNVAHWNKGGENVEGTYARFALPIMWDFAEVNPISSTSGGYENQLEWVSLFIEHAMKAMTDGSKADVRNASAVSLDIEGAQFDVIVTDPPYYDAIPYSDLMDFFYIWMRRACSGVLATASPSFNTILSPKWDEKSKDGELIDDSSRFNGDSGRSKMEYENGMRRAFTQCNKLLVKDGRFVIVFAHKQPDAWETLASAIVQSGFLVEGCWPIQTERVTRTRAISSSALSSSVWLVCRKRAENAVPGWDSNVLDEMRSNIKLRLREYWDAGIRGPDFIWAATGPALEAYSRHPIVKKANDPGSLMTVSEFLKEVRRIVMDFVVGRVLGEEGDRDRELDNVTTYYLLHRHDFGFDDAPSGSCILYAVSCDLSDNALAGEHDILLRSGGIEEPEDDEAAETDEDVLEGTSSSFRLKSWANRRNKNLGLDSASKPAPMVDRVHKLMHLWKEGDIVKVNEYLDVNGLVKNKTFHRILQAIIELSKEGDEERSLMESISNHIVSRGGAVSAPKSISEYGGSN